MKIRIFFLLGTVEVCSRETFNASCAAGSVVIIERARVGRMRLNRCVTADLGGVLGCNRDVTEVLAGRCSGRRQCAVEVLDDAISGMNPCHIDVTLYLEVTYKCLAG